jgi:hypothetical protein
MFFYAFVHAKNCLASKVYSLHSVKFHG